MPQTLGTATPLITTIVPTFRRPALLGRALRSVLAQTFGDFRVCVYDNASGDETERVVVDIAKADARVVYHRHAANVGSLNNFIFGMRRVDTPYFSFLSDDDVLFANFFQTALDGFGRHPEAMLSIGSTLEFDQAGRLLYAPLTRWPREGLYAPPNGMFAMLGNRHPTWTSVLMRRENIEQVGLLDAEVGGPADLDYELRVAARFPVVISFKACAAYVKHPGSSSVREDTSVIAGYLKISKTLRQEPSLDQTARARVDLLLARQIDAKLLEICVKSIVHGDEQVACDAARMLQTRLRRGLVGSCFRLAVGACLRWRLLRALLSWSEAARLAVRSYKASRALGAFASIGLRPKWYARYLTEYKGRPVVG